ncbi:hypothetical protein NQ176_g6607 [Zarea fungicola]|uniref:Uncharacterized protein n=1 Tax=Zarea fungicola TaxID=93591 RepID=A0ACC1N2F7_9HYPO|nr:hypothetical protein NQ176_g6607 [Lecanicillium fungicola]
MYGVRPPPKIHTWSPGSAVRVGMAIFIVFVVNFGFIIGDFMFNDFCIVIIVLVWGIIALTGSLRVLLARLLPTALDSNTATGS